MLRARQFKAVVELHRKHTTFLNSAHTTFPLCFSQSTTYCLLRNHASTSTQARNSALRIIQRVRLGFRTQLNELTLSRKESLAVESKDENEIHTDIKLKSETTTLKRLFEDLKEDALSAFLPKGYPESVTSNYKYFVLWQFVHNVTGSVTGVLSTQSLLHAIGLGAGAIPLAASLNWIIKDGLGQLGGVVYAAFINDKFDSDPKRFRFQATVVMQMASGLELLTPLWPGMFLLIASTSNIGKNMAWLASSATRAAMHQTFALRNNLGDITGKSGSQSTAAGLIGTGLGVLVSTIIHYMSTNSILDMAAHPIQSLMIAFLPFSLATIYANYKSNLYVTSSTLNIPRAENILIRISKESEQNVRQAVPTPNEVSAEEVFVTKYRSSLKIPIIMEPDLRQFLDRPKLANVILRTFKHMDFMQPESYYILIDGSNQSKPRVCLWFSKEAKQLDMLKGFYHAFLIRHEMQHSGVFLNLSQHERGNIAIETEIVRGTHQKIGNNFGSLVEGLSSKGWDLDRFFLSNREDQRLSIHFLRDDQC